MLKGIPQEFRDIRWHRKHLARLKKRKDKRRNFAFLSHTPQMKKAEEEYQRARARDLEQYRGMFGWLLKLYHQFLYTFKRYIRLTPRTV